VHLRIRIPLRQTALQSAMRRPFTAVTVSFTGLLLLLAGLTQAAGAACLTPGAWMRVSGEGRSPVAPQRVFDELAQRRVVLLGENHDNAEHHRWQLHAIAALHARLPRLVLGFEMFPRRVQPALDQWTAGQLTEAQFLERTQWSLVWGHDAQLYLPIFHFARMHGVPMIALNVERSLVRRVGAEGWAAVPPGEREGVGDPAPASPAYLRSLYESYLSHLPGDQRPSRIPTEDDLREPAFLRFMQSMQVWDRAMAEGIAQRLTREPGAAVVAIMGSGHLRGGYGVPHQLRELGVGDAVVALPWETSEDCAELTSGASDLVFGVGPYAEQAAERPRLGVRLDDGSDGVLIQEVVADSVAQAAGIRAGDVVKVIAGLPVRQADDVLAAVRRQAPGTWLPLTVQRGTQSLELVARFPPKR
jgi:uncharacterized iron-regulated protein